MRERRCALGGGWRCGGEVIIEKEMVEEERRRDGKGKMVFAQFCYDLMDQKWHKRVKFAQYDGI